MTIGDRRIAKPAGDPRVELVQLSRALSHLGLLDARGRASTRVGEGIVTTPRPGGGAPPPGLMTVEDLVVLDIDGGVRSGRWSPPVEIGVDLAIYRRRPPAGAIVHAQPRTALAFCAAGRDLLPVAHTESALVHHTVPRIAGGAPPASAEEVDRIVRSLGDGAVAILVGDGSLAIGRIPAEAAMLTQQIELLAQSNALAIELSAPGSPKVVDAADSERIHAQKAPPDDFMSYYADVAAYRPAATTPPDPDDASEEGLRRRIVAACRLLYHHRLIEHLEHVSVRVGDGSTFLITPRGHLGRLAPDQIATVDMEGGWVAGPLEPPPFRHFHRDIFLARPEVRAIVHTHQPHARAMAVAGVALRPLHRSGAAELVGPEPVYDVPDLMFDIKHRGAAVRLLGTASMLHERSHGVDFLSDTVEAATVHALHYEDHARMHLIASRVGTPAPLPSEVAEGARRIDPAPLDWWRHHLAELPSSE